MLNKSGESGHPCLVPDFSGNDLFFFTIENNVSCTFIIYGLYYVELGSFYAHLLKSLIINGCWILSKHFSASIEINIWFLSFNLSIYISHWLICIYWRILAFLKQTQFDHGIWAFWCVAEFCLLKFCWGFLHLCSSVILACSFLILCCLCLVLLSGWW